MLAIFNYIRLLGAFICNCLPVRDEKFVDPEGPFVVVVGFVICLFIIGLTIPYCADVVKYFIGD